VIYINKPADEWALKFGLKTEMECPACKKTYPLSRPFIMKGYAGLEMQEHGCYKDRSGPFVVTPNTPDTINFWDGIL